MKASKTLFFALAMAFAMSINAKIFEDNHFTANLNLGSTDYGWTVASFGLGVGFQTGIYSNDWISLAWDVAQVEWVAPFKSPEDWDELHVRSGLRAFSPSFAGGKVRAYTNLDMGYSCIFVDSLLDGMKGHSSFGLAYGVGLQLQEKLSVGYSLGYVTWDKSKNHFLSIGYTF